MTELPFVPRTSQPPYPPPSLRFVSQDGQNLVSPIASPLSPATRTAPKKTVSFVIDQTTTPRTASYSPGPRWNLNPEIPLSPLARSTRRHHSVTASPVSARSFGVSRRSKTSLETPFVQIDAVGPSTEVTSPQSVKIYKHNQTGNKSTASACQTPRRTDSKKRAVLVGITYAATKDVGILPKSADHLALFHNLLIMNHGFDKRNIWLLSDKPHCAAGAVLLEPTRENIMNAMKWLVVNSRPGDNLIFAFCGHGVQRHKEGSRSIIQCIIPSDYPTASLITGETISSLLIGDLNIGVHMTVILDCRFSSQILTLPYIHSIRRGKKNQFFVSDSVEVVDKDPLYRISPMHGITGYSRHTKEYLELKKEVEEEQREALAAALFEKGDLVCLTMSPESSKKLISFSSRNREQTSLSSAFVSVMSNNIHASQDRKMSFSKLLKDISALVGKGRHSFLPQLSSSYKLKIEDHVFNG